MKYSIYYLIGAGASAQKWENDIYNQFRLSLPLAHDFDVRINQILGHGNSGDILKSNEIYMNDLIDFSKFISQFNSIDEAMRKLYLNNETIKFNHYKKLISLVFYLYEYVESFRDTRYSQFLLTIINKEFSLPKNIKILSWNYDNQFEYAAREIRNEFNNKTLIYNDNFYKINGSANEGLPEKTKIIYDEKGYVNNISKIQEEINIIMEFDSNLRFAWEEYFADKKSLISLDLDSFLNPIHQKNHQNILVTIGYSFPFVNHLYDLHLLKTIKPNVIYYQDKINNSASLSERFGIDFKHINDCSRFYIPNEMYEGFNRKYGEYHFL